jgi:D-glycero-D-manno-heptose 1,7-bisphosphate phosphatase
MTLTAARAIFFDRDGTLICDQYPHSRAESVELRPGAAQAFRLAKELGFRLVIVTNQSGVARGLFDEQAVAAVNRRMAQLLGVEPCAMYSCFHHPSGVIPRYSIDCDCRKPKPGMLKRAERELGVSLQDSFLIGDSFRDIEAGRAAGTRSILLRGEELEKDPRAGARLSHPDYVADDLDQALGWIRQALSNS